MKIIKLPFKTLKFPFGGFDSVGTTNYNYRSFRTNYEINNKHIHSSENINKIRMKINEVSTNRTLENNKRNLGKQFLRRTEKINAINNYFAYITLLFSQHLTHGWHLVNICQINMKAQQ